LDRTQHRENTVRQVLCTWKRASDSDEGILAKLGADPHNGHFGINPHQPIASQPDCRNGELLVLLRS
jgi:galactose-1-phosphate uridylyltransferase